VVGKRKLAIWGKVWRMIIAVGVPLLVGGVSAALTMGTMQKFGQFNQPPLSPPAWLFPVAWTILYILMGVASYLIAGALRENKGKKSAKSIKTVKLARIALVIYNVQLAFNFVWSILFFNLELRWFAFGWLIAMWLMSLVLAIISYRLNKGAFWCLFPYLLWTTFAAYLNAGVAILN